MDIKLPAYFHANNFTSLFRTLVSPTRTPMVGDRVNIDFSDLQFIEPTGVTVLSNLIEWLAQYGVHVTFNIGDTSRDCIRHMDRSGFFERYTGNRLFANSQLRTTTKPLEFINAANSFFWLQHNLMSWITTNSGKSFSTFRELLACFQEVFQNIRDHSGTNIGSVFAQFYPASGKLCISISDIGIGIPNKVRRFLGPEGQNINDSSAIITASREGFTTSTHAGNAGRGLAVLTNTVCNYYQGQITIVSDKGYVFFAHGRQNATDRDWIYPGCLIDILLDISKIPNVEDNNSETYEWQ